MPLYESGLKRGLSCRNQHFVRKHFTHARRSTADDMIAYEDLTGIGLNTPVAPLFMSPHRREENKQSMKLMYQK